MRLITPVKRLALGVLVFALLGFAWDEIAIDLQVDSSEVRCVYA